MLGVALAVAITTSLAHSGFDRASLARRRPLDGAALLWTVCIAIVAALLFGTVPALKLSAGNLQQSSQRGRARHDGRAGNTSGSARPWSSPRWPWRASSSSAPGLLLRSFLRVLEVDLGFRPERAAVIRVAYDGSDARAGLRAELRADARDVEAIPGVSRGGFSDMLPLGRNRSWGLSAKGTVLQERERLIVHDPRRDAGVSRRPWACICEDGRDFTWQDGTRDTSPSSSTRPRRGRHWGSVDPVGRTALCSPNGEALVVGVVADVRQQSVESGVAREMFQPVAQADPEGAQLVVRTTRPLDSLTADVMRTLRTLNPGQPAAALEPLQQIVDRSVSSRRFFVALVGMLRRRSACCWRRSASTA